MKSETHPLDSNLAMILIDQAPDAMIFADSTGTIRFWNDAATRIFGFSAELALGANLDIIIPERFRERHSVGFDRALADRITQYVGQPLPTRASRSDGSQITVELSFAVILDDEGQSLGAVAHARDITERFEQERQNRKRIEQLEKA